MEVSAAGDQVEQVHLGSIRYRGRMEVRAGNDLVTDADDGAMVFFPELIEEIRNRHPLAPVYLSPVYHYHCATPCTVHTPCVYATPCDLLSTSSTSGKSIPNRFTVSMVGMPSFVQPLR